MNHGRGPQLAGGSIPAVGKLHGQRAGLVIAAQHHIDLDKFFAQGQVIGPTGVEAFQIRQRPFPLPQGEQGLAEAGYGDRIFRINLGRLLEKLHGPGKVAPLLHDIAQGVQIGKVFRKFFK